MSVRRLGLFAKYWQPGCVKTRLAAAIGDEAAAQLHRQFVEMLLARLADEPVQRVVLYSPPQRRPEFHALAARAGGAWELRAQCDGDLGARLEHFFATAFQEGCTAALAIGADSPTLPRTLLTQAWELLESVPVVLGPADDGGYYLLGLCPPLPPIFHEMPWSTSQLLKETRTRLQAAGIPHATLPPWYDVDDLEGLNRLRAELRSMQRRLAETSANE